MESKLQYYMRVFRGASFKKFFKVLDNAHERSGKNKIYLFFDMLHCMKRYGAGYAGGILSAAVDGIRQAENWLSQHME